LCSPQSGSLCHCTTSTARSSFRSITLLLRFPARLIRPTQVAVSGRLWTDRTGAILLRMETFGSIVHCLRHIVSFFFFSRQSSLARNSLDLPLLVSLPTQIFLR
jgi:hypothetical protein